MISNSHSMENVWLNVAYVSPIIQSAGGAESYGGQVDQYEEKGKVYYKQMPVAD